MAYAKSRWMIYNGHIVADDGNGKLRHVLTVVSAPTATNSRDQKIWDLALMENVKSLIALHNFFDVDIEQVNKLLANNTTFSAMLKDMMLNADLANGEQYVEDLFPAWLIDFAGGLKSIGSTQKPSDYYLTTIDSWRNLKQNPVEILEWCDKPLLEVMTRAQCVANEHMTVIVVIDSATGIPVGGAMPRDL